MGLHKPTNLFRRKVKSHSVLDDLSNHDHPQYGWPHRVQQSGQCYWGEATGQAIAGTSLKANVFVLAPIFLGESFNPVGIGIHVGTVVEPFPPPANPDCYNFALLSSDSNYLPETVLYNTGWKNFETSAREYSFLMEIIEQEPGLYYLGYILGDTYGRVCSNVETVNPIDEWDFFGGASMTSLSDNVLTFDYAIPNYVDDPWTSLDVGSLTVTSYNRIVRLLL